jgi:hypothetical protein
MNDGVEGAEAHMQTALAQNNLSELAASANLLARMSAHKPWLCDTLFDAAKKLAENEATVSAALLPAAVVVQYAYTSSKYRGEAVEILFKALAHKDADAVDALRAASYLVRCSPRNAERAVPEVFRHLPSAKLLDAGAAADAARFCYHISKNPDHIRTALEILETNGWPVVTPSGPHRPKPPRAVAGKADTKPA